MNKLLLVALLALAPITFACADYKVAVVDLEKAFNQYYKMKEASAQLENKKAQFQKEIQDIVAQYQSKTDEAKRLYEASNDQTLAANARSEKAAAFKAKSQDVQNMQSKIQEMQTERGNEIRDEYLRRRKEIVDEICKVVVSVSTPQGYDIVLDKSAASASSGVPLVLFSSPKITDITEDVVKTLNASAPSSAATGASAPATPAPAAK